ncbi:MAG: HNH endonuclease [Acidimicrobiia bacterium]|nr:HNH endonuclease [Acidimicrobiia bacterium]
MSVFILTWSPVKRQMSDEEYDDKVARTEGTRSFESDWSTGGRNSGIQENDLALLLRQHSDRGIVARGRFASEIYQDTHWDGSSRNANYADINFSTWLPLEDRLPIEVLLREVPEVPWNNLQASGVQVPPGADQRLLDLWNQHLQGLVRPAEELPPGTYPEGATKQVMVNRYERSTQARRACIGRYGTTCVACGFDFARTYGEHGKDFIHVHHLKEVSKLPEGYEVDPIKDLRPVCANCHAMIHRGDTMLTIKQLQNLIAKA